MMAKYTVAFAVEDTLDGKHGLPAWKWLFLIEGVLPIGWAIIIFLLLPPSPEGIRFGFSAPERALLIARSRAAYSTYLFPRSE